MNKYVEQVSIKLVTQVSTQCIVRSQYIPSGLGVERGGARMRPRLCPPPIGFISIVCRCPYLVERKSRAADPSLSRLFCTKVTSFTYHFYDTIGPIKLNNRGLQDQWTSHISCNILYLYMLLRVLWRESDNTCDTYPSLHNLLIIRTTKWIHNYSYLYVSITTSKLYLINWIHTFLDIFTLQHYSCLRLPLLPVTQSIRLQ
jgi:hypothetical protein